MEGLVVLGAGIAGISAAYHARQAGTNAVVFEAEDRWGGLLDFFTLDGFRFDNAVHFAFTDDPGLQRILDRTPHHVHRPRPYNYERGRWLKHPVQNNLFPLPAGEKVEAIKSFLDRPDLSGAADYREWLVQQYGEVIARRFPMTYTRKYWTVPAERLGTEWIGCRMYRPSLDEVLFGAMTAETPQTYYVKKMLYPRRGGFRSFLEPLVEHLDIRTGKRAVYIEPRKKYVEFADGTREHYRRLVSSIPLPELVPMLEGTPAAVREAAATLWATSVALVSLGFTRPDVTDLLWFYVYDPAIMPARVYAPHLKSPDNVPPGCSSLQFEIYYSRHAPLPGSPDSIVEHVAEVTERQFKFAARGEIGVTDFRVLPYGNVVFDLGMTRRRDLVTEYLTGLGILPVGRFGEWDYLWSNQCFESGKKVLSILKD